jgi:hypothetical protein
MRENYPDFLCMKCNAHICCLYFMTSNPGILQTTYPGKGYIRGKRRWQKRGEKIQQKNKKAGSTKDICQGSTSLPHLRLGALTFEKKGIHCINDGSRQLMHEEVHKIYLFIFLSLYPKILAIASGATPIGSAERAPDDIYSWVLKQKEQIRKFYYSHREQPFYQFK